MTTGRDSAQFLLRLPDGMRERLAEVAKANGRSMNAEIVHRLSRSLEDSALTQVIANLDASMEPHERVSVIFSEAMDAMLRVKVALKREYGIETPMIEDD